MMSPKTWFSNVGKMLSGKNADNKATKKDRQKSFWGTPKSKSAKGTPKAALSAGGQDEQQEGQVDPLSDVVVDNIIMAMSYVTANFVTEEGLYRVPGDKKDVETLTGSMLQHPITPSVLDGYEANDICGAIKGVLQKCEPVFPTDSFDELLSCADTDPADAETTAVPIIRAVVSDRMPPLNFKLFCHLILHFRELIDQVGSCRVALL